MTKFGNDVVTYDSRGRISKFGSKSYTYDNYGNRTGDGIKTYTWVRGRLLSSVGGASFKYDVNGKRFSKTAGGVTATYYYDEDMLLGENRSDGKKLRYFYDSEGMCGFRYYNGSAWTEYVYVKNAKGDVLAILNGSGTVVANYSYDAWGNCTIESQTGGMGDINPIRYRGYYYDGETGLYYLLTRYYDPAIGHFISPDGFEYLDPETIGAINLYAYCRYNPVMNVDPTGDSFILAMIIGGAIAGAIIGATANGVKAYSEGARGWDLAGAIVAGAAVGGIAGGIIGAGAGALFGGAAAGGALTIVGGGTAAAGAAISASAAGTAVLTGLAAGIGIGAGILFSYNASRYGSSKLGSNQYFNKQFADFCRAHNIKDKNLIRKFHDYITKKGYNQWKQLEIAWQEFLLNK